MAKLNAEEFIKKYTEGEKKASEDEDLLLEMMEDATDSIGVDSAEKEELERIKAENARLSADYNDLKDRYKNRFLDSQTFVEKEKEIEEPEEKEVIDIKEI